MPMRPGVALLPLLILLPACEAFKGGPDIRINPLKPLTDEYWQIEPVQVRVYPSTRFVFEEGLPILDARIEFQDAAGDTMKAVGDLRFELAALTPSGEPRVNDPLYEWFVPMRTLEENKRFYDGITRSYAYRLKLETPAIGNEAVMLIVTYTPPEGKRLSARTVLPPAFEGLE